MLTVRYHSAGICAGGALTPSRFKRDMPQRECRHLWIMQRMWGEQLRKKSNPMDPSHSRFPFHCWNPFFFSKKWERQRQELRFLHLQALISFLIYSTGHKCVYPLCVLHGLEGKKDVIINGNILMALPLWDAIWLALGFACAVIYLNLMWICLVFFFLTLTVAQWQKSVCKAECVHTTHSLTDLSFKRLS